MANAEIREEFIGEIFRRELFAVSNAGNEREKEIWYRIRYIYIYTSRDDGVLSVHFIDTTQYIYMYIYWCPMYIRYVPFHRCITKYVYINAIRRPSIYKLLHICRTPPPCFNVKQVCSDFRPGL